MLSLLTFLQGSPLKNYIELWQVVNGFDNLYASHILGREQTSQRLKDKETREEFKSSILKDNGWDNMIKEIGWPRIVVVRVNTEENKEFEGKNLKEIASMRGQEPFEACFDLLIEEEMDIDVVLFGMCEEDVQTVLKDNLTMVCTDASALTPEGILGEGKPHPRTYGTYPRILGKYVKEENVLSLCDAIRKMTSFPAQKLGLKDRGLVGEGYKADLVIFDPDEIRDKATFMNPHQFPDGFEYILVNGRLVVKKGKHTGKKPGKVLVRGD